MKFTVTTVALTKALKQITPAISGNTILPLYSNVFVSINKDKCEIAATNGSVIVRTIIDCSSEKQFNLLIPFKELHSICSVSSDTLEVENTKEGINIKSGNRKYKLGISDDASLFPKDEGFEALFSMQVDKEFLNGLQQSNKCTLKGNNEYDFKKFVCIDATEGEINIVSTDNTCLFRYKEDYNGEEKIKTLIDPDFIKATFGLSNGTISISEKFIKLETLETTVIGRIGEQKFPNYDVFYPKYKSNCTVNKDEFINALSSILVFGTENKGCYLNFEKNKIRFELKDDALNRGSESEIECIHSVGFEKIKVSTNTLRNMMSVLPDAEEMNMYFEAIEKPIHIDIKEKGVHHLVMPFAQQD